ncbi:porin [Neisseria animalis]|uniref:Porin n=1 Tax=Neisseria animalis TaxID=492 RepID=A0A5P3MT33_NEIAN|nr:porin [Neisseria animalis]QEY24763.1 porin [Neisseria animalis]ROW31837.1 porin [Neisseria animalis]VEE07763.1 porin [Neisseria animalis]
MKKTIIAMALACLPLAAAADTTLYGQIKSSISASQVKIKSTDGMAKSAAATRINDNTSRIGVKGSETLGGDTKLIWQLEQRVSVLGDRQGWGTRDSFIGLQGKFGTLRAGNLNNILHEMDGFNPWMGTPSAAELGLSAYRGGSRSISVRYESPKFAGIHADLQYAPRDNQNPTDRYTHEKAGRDQYTAGLTYTRPNHYAKLAYTLRKNRVGSEDGQVARLETAYHADKVFLGLGLSYSRANENANTYLGYFTDGFNRYNHHDITADSRKNEAVESFDAALTAGYNSGNFRPRISYAHGRAAKGMHSGKTLVDKFDQLIVGGDYRLSKRTSLRGQLAYLRVGGNTLLYTDAANRTHKGKIEQTAASLGLHHRF